MRPTLTLLDAGLEARVLDEAFELLREPGVKVHEAEACDLLAAAGADVRAGVARIPETVVRDALATVPRSFSLHDRAGRPAVRYGEGAVQFDPGSCGVAVLDPDTLEHRPSMAADLVRLIRVAEGLDVYAAQSTAVVCGDVPPPIGDLWRLLLVLLDSDKPVVTGGFGIRTTQVMLDMLAIDAGGAGELAARPRAVFDVCPSPPLSWSELGCRNLIDLARMGVPAQMVSMPLAGGAAPVTLIGSVVQHAAECLSGIAIHQLASPGSPIVWGGAPAILDMRSGTTPMGAVETAMIDAAYAQVGRGLGLPTHTYLVGSDSKLVDAQAGMESATGAVIAALAGVDLVSGAGMLDTLLCHSAEKLVVDAEAISSALRLVAGIGTPTETLATGAFAAAGPEGRFLELPETRRLFRTEQHIPSNVIERRSYRAWADAGAYDAFAHARDRADALVAAWQPPLIDSAAVAGIIGIARREAEAIGMMSLPGVDEARLGKG
jgi:trimethylamine---corrinoid protein Co-methyltransferase